MESQSETPPNLQSRIAELSEFLSNLTPQSSSSSIQPCLQALQTNLDQIVSEHSHILSFQHQHLHEFENRLTEELKNIEAETASLSTEIHNLNNSKIQGICQLEGTLESLRHVAQYAHSQGLGQGEIVDKVKSRDVLLEAKALDSDYFEILKLKDQIDKNEITLKSLEDLDLNLKRIETIDHIQEELTGLKVIDYEGNTIRVSMKTYIPDIDGVMCQMNAEDNIKQSEVNHELLIEVTNGTMEVKNVEIFPNDVYLGEIVEAANTFSKLFSPLVSKTRSSLGWFLQKVQDRIVMCTIRQIMVKIANQSRHSFEYLDKDELIVVHMVGGLDAFIKPSQGWPLSDSSLKLVSFRNPDQHAKEISFSLLSKVEEVANSFDLNIRKSLTNFVDAIEETIMEKLRPEQLC